MDSSAIAAYFAELGAYERHLNDTQARYRALASTWLLAAFAGIGFLLSKNLSLKIDKGVLVGAIALVAAFGVAMLWNLDVRMYHRLLEAVFKAAEEFELAHMEIPRVRHFMADALKWPEAPRRVGVFYIGTCALLLLIAWGSFIAWAQDEIGWWTAPASAGVAIGIAQSLAKMNAVTCTPIQWTGGPR
jgi:hypothetical protein